MHFQSCCFGVVGDLRVFFVLSQRGIMLRRWEMMIRRKQVMVRREEVMLRKQEMIPRRPEMTRAQQINIVLAFSCLPTSMALQKVDEKLLKTRCYAGYKAISHKKLLGYLHGRVVPYGRSQSMVKD